MNDQRTINGLVKENQGYVVSLAKKYLHHGMDLEDLVSEGNIGMIRAAQSFDASKGSRFVSYAAPFIKDCIEKALKVFEERSPLSVDEPLPVGSSNTINLLHVMADPHATHPDERIFVEADEQEVGKMLAQLNDRQQTVIREFYGLGCERHTMAEIGEAHGWKRERVRQIRKKALRRLAKVKAIVDLL
ncbi:MAG: sigma-70 family RNA polymerase sigma factor [Prevotella sp.]|uniref:sigma-70 family RNA polymerase sigma factor n=1 Tax=Prevotella sp. AGR2160 TaxID=1280674 RepID=UPI0004046561